MHNGRTPNTSFGSSPGERIREDQVGACVRGATEPERPYDPELYEKAKAVGTVAGQIAGSTDPGMIERQIRDRFAYHRPMPHQVARYELLRDDFTNLAIRISKHTQYGPNQEAALEALHIALMLANRAIALEKV